VAFKYRTKGFVFRKNNSLEADRSFSIFTEDFGRIEVRGRAIRKIDSKLRSGLDIFCLSEIEFIQGKNSKTLTDASIIKRFRDVNTNFRSLKIAHLISDILNNFLKGQEKDESLSFLIEEVFEKLNNKEMRTEIKCLIYYYFIWNFLSLQGYKPDFHNCSICREKINLNNIYLCYKEGGVVCEKCFQKKQNILKINSDIVKILRLILEKDWQTISKLKMNFNSQKLLHEVSEDAIRTFCPS
jgi:DNA repair protein RecO (recombination protein O)